MTSKAAANRYARALFEVGLKEHTDLEQIEAQLAAFAGLFSQYPTLEKVLLNPAVPVPRKRAAVAELVAKMEIGSILSKLLGLLAERDRLIVVPDLLAAFRERLLEHQHVVRAHVTTAAPISDERARDIEHRLAQVTGRRVTVSTYVDPSLLGGLVARIGGTVYDASLTRQLEKMRARLIEGV